MRILLFAFHDADDCCLSFEFPIERHSFVGFSRLFLGLLCLNSVDFDFNVFIREIGVVYKSVRVVYFPSCRLFQQRSQPRTCERL